MTESLVRLHSEANAPPASPGLSAESKPDDVSALFFARDWSELIPARQHLLTPVYKEIMGRLHVLMRSTLVTRQRKVSNMLKTIFGPPSNRKQSRLLSTTQTDFDSSLASVRCQAIFCVTRSPALVDTLGLLCHR